MGNCTTCHDADKGHGVGKGDLKYGTVRIKITCVKDDKSYYIGYPNNFIGSTNAQKKLRVASLDGDAPIWQMRHVDNDERIFSAESQGFTYYWKAQGDDNYNQIHCDTTDQNDATRFVRDENGENLKVLETGKYLNVETNGTIKCDGDAGDLGMRYLLMCD